jgi:hypothetical protein
MLMKTPIAGSAAWPTRKDAGLLEVMAWYLDVELARLDLDVVEGDEGAGESVDPDPVIPRSAPRFYPDNAYT